MAGRPKRETEVEVVFLRLPKDLVERVTRCKGKIEMQEGVSLNTTKAYCRILEAGCEALGGSESLALVAMPETSVLAEISSISNGAPMAYDDMLGFLGDEEEEEPPAQPVDVPQTAETPSTAAEPVPDLEHDDNTVLHEVEETEQKASPTPEPGEMPAESKKEQTGTRTIALFPDPSKYKMGKLCPRRHDFERTGQSLLYLRNSKCVECDKEEARERRKAKVPRVRRKAKSQPQPA